VGELLQVNRHTLLLERILGLHQQELLLFLLYVLEAAAGQVNTPYNLNSAVVAANSATKTVLVLPPETPTQLLLVQVVFL
jgi:hypothetical protein